MLKMKIELMIVTEQGGSPHKATLCAITALHRAVENATEETPALDGVLRDELDMTVGSYVVTFNT